MHVTTTDRAGGGGGSWRLPPDETLQVADSKSKEDAVSYIKNSFKTWKIFINHFLLTLQDLYPPEGHNWRSIIFSLLVIGFVITGIITAIYLLGYVVKNKKF